MTLDILITDERIIDFVDTFCDHGVHPDNAISLTAEALGLTRTYVADVWDEASFIPEPDAYSTVLDQMLDS